MWARGSAAAPGPGAAAGDPRDGAGTAAAGVASPLLSSRRGAPTPDDGRGAAYTAPGAWLSADSLEFTLDAGESDCDGEAGPSPVARRTPTRAGRAAGRSAAATPSTLRHPPSTHASAACNSSSSPSSSSSSSSSSLRAGSRAGSVDVGGSGRRPQGRAVTRATLGKPSHSFNIDTSVAGTTASVPGSNWSSPTSSRRNSHRGSAGGAHDPFGIRARRCCCSVCQYRHAVLIALLSSFGGFLFGYDLGLMSGAVPYLRVDLALTTVEVELAVAFAKVGALFGTFVGGFCMWRWGCRIATAVSASFFIAGPILMAVAGSSALLMTGRLVAGLGIGVSAVVGPQYIAEVARPELRGRLVSLYEFLLCVGILLSILVDFVCSEALPVAGGVNWRVMVGLPAVFAMPILLILRQPESPRWLQNKHRGAEALAVARRLHLPDRECRLFGPDHHGGGGAGEFRRIGGCVGGDTLTGDTAGAMGGGGGGWHHTRALPTTTLTASAVSAHADGSWAAGDAAEADDSDFFASGETDISNSAVYNNNSRRHLSFGSIGAGGRVRHSHHSFGGVSYCDSDSDGGGGRGDARGDNVSSRGGGGDVDVRQGCRRFLQLLGGLCRGPERHSFAVVMVLAAFNQMMGSSAIIDYAPTLLESLQGTADVNGTVDVRHLACDEPDVPNGTDLAPDPAALVGLLGAGNASAAPSTAAATTAGPSGGISSTSLNILYTSFLAVAKIVGLLLESLLIDSEKYGGRRPLFIGGSFFMAAGMCAIAAGVYFVQDGVVLGAMVFFVLSFSASWAGGFWIVLSESLSQRSKPIAAPIATAVMYSGGALANVLFLQMMCSIGYLAFVVFGAVALASGVYVALALKETRNKSLSEIQVLYGAGGARAGTGTGTGAQGGVPDQLESLMPTTYKTMSSNSIGGGSDALIDAMHTDVEC